MSQKILSPQKVLTILYVHILMYAHLGHGGTGSNLGIEFLQQLSEGSPEEVGEVYTLAHLAPSFPSLCPLLGALGRE